MAERPADLVLTGGAVYTVDAARSWAQAVAISGGQIVAVGTDSGMRPYVGPRTEVINLRGRMLLPGFTEGFRNIARDEHRHVAYGTWFLQQKVRAQPEAAGRIQEKLAELLPIAAAVLVPPGLQLGDSYELLGYSSDEVNQYAFTALSRRLRVIGVSLPAVAA